MAETKASDIYGSDTLAQYISTLYKDFADGRLPQEDIWKECWWNFIAQYNPETTLTSTEGNPGRCKLFFRLTPQKVRAAHAKIMESIGLEVPFKLVPLIDTPLNEYKQQDVSVAKKDIIRNQFNKIGLRDVFDTETMLMCIYGTGILKGPVFRTETEAVVEENVRQVMGLKVPMWKIPGRNYSRFRRTYQKRIVKDVVGVSIWDFFVDNNADTAEKSIGVIERHKYSPYEFQNKFFGSDEYDKENVIAAYNSACVPEDVRDLQIIKADKFVDVTPPKDLKISVLEYWGQAPYGLLKPYLKAVDNENGEERYSDTDIVECSVIMSGVDNDTHTLRSQNILQAKLNPTGKRIYKVCPFVKNPGSPWGIGVAESVRDSQKVINSFSRLMVDNKVLSGNGMFAIQRDLIDTRATKNGFKLYPGKIFFTKGDANAAIKPLLFPDVTAGLEMALDRFERWADEESGIPKYTQGESAGFLNKMLDIFTPVPMADGTYKILRDIEDGDWIVGRSGLPTKVLKAHKIHFPERAYEIVFKSGEKIVAGGEHLWTVENESGKQRTIDTDSLYEYNKNYKAKVFIPRVERVFTGREIELPLDPYILGVWLGDGHTYAPRITTPDAYIVERLKEYAKSNGGDVKKDKTQNAGLATTYYIDGLYKPLNKLGLLRRNSNDDKEGKHIPEIYFNASYAQRLELLRGLMDTDGCQHSYNLSIFTQKEGRLLEDVIRLIAGLGGFPRKCKTNPGKLAREGEKYFNVNFSLADNPFHLPKKANKWNAPSQKHNRQSIISITPVKVRLMRCLTVDAEDGLFCVGKRFTVTHNTATGMSMIINQSNVFLKTTIRNIDQYWIKPIAQEFNNLNEIDGSYPTAINVPMDVVAMGVDSLMAKEIKFESAMKLFQVAKETDMLPYLRKQTALKVVSDLLDVKDLVVNEVEAQQIEQQLAQQAQTMSQAKLSANIDANILNALSATERAQLVAKMGIIGDPQAPAELLMKKAQELELDTQSKIMINDRKALGKAQGQAANDILKDVMTQGANESEEAQEPTENEPQGTEQPGGSEDQQ